MICIHHFRIAEPNGPFSEGKCQKCPETRLFRNSDNYALVVTSSKWTSYLRQPKGLKGLNARRLGTER